MFRIALKSVLARKRRLVTTGLAIVLSVAFISGTMVLSDVLDHGVKNLVSAGYAGNDAIVRSSSVQESQFGGTAYRPPIDAGLIGAVRHSAGVARAEGTVFGYPTLLDHRGKRIGAAGIGAPTIGYNWIDDVALMGGRLVAGRAPTAPDEVTLDEDTARQSGFSVGQRLTMQVAGGSGTFRIVGVTALGSTGHATTGAHVVTFALARAQQLFGKVGSFDYIGVIARPGVGQAALVRGLRRVLPRGVQAVTGAAFVAEQQQQFGQIVSLITNFILAFGWISVFVGAFVIYNTFTIIVAQRTRELALLRAVGASRRQLLSSVLVEAVAVGTVAAAIGIVCGLGLATGLKALLGSFVTLPTGLPRLTAPVVAVALGVGVVTTVVSAFIPAIRATRIAPVAALSDVGLDHAHLSRARTAAGAVLAVVGAAAIAAPLTHTWDLGIAGVGVGAALLFVAVAVGGPVLAAPVSRVLGRPLRAARGVTGRIAAENAARNPSRTAVTAAALTIGVGLVTVIVVFAASLQGSFSSTFAAQLARVDAVVDAGTGEGGIPLGLRPALARLPEVRRVTSIRWTPLTILNSVAGRAAAAAAPTSAASTGSSGGAGGSTAPVGEARWILGVDAATLLQMVQVDGISPAVHTIADDQVMVLRATAEKNHWKPGDVVDVYFARTGVRHLRLAATFDTRLSGADYLVNFATFERNALPELLVDSQVWIQLRSGVTLATARPALERTMTRLAPAASINDVQSFVAQRSALFTPLLNMIYGLLALAVVIALVGVANTISLSIFERTRELGLLRAVGMARAQLRSSVRWESAIIALLGTVLGLVVGVVLAVAFVVALDENGVSPIVPGGQLVVIAVVGALAGIVTALRPARRAARLDVLAAIASA